MTRDRRQFLKTTAAAATLASFPAHAQEEKAGYVGRHDITAPFRDLHGDIGMRILVPPQRGRRGFTAQINAGRMLFAASSIKTFALGEALRQVDAPDVTEVLEAKELTLDERVWSLGSPIFNPPDLTGLVSERTTLEAMICRSDNTATDMIFNHVGSDNIRRLIGSLGLAQTRVPDNTRIFGGYLFGAPNYKTVTWDEILLLASTGQVVHPFLNDVQTLASSPDDLVKYYAHALQGTLFEHRETLQEFRRILTLCDYIHLIPLPLGVSAYMKSGNADAPGFHVRAIAGGLYAGDRWIFFAFMLNWYAETPSDDQTVERLFAAINESLARVIGGPA
jgi:beta-lactamase class A